MAPSTVVRGSEDEQPNATPRRDGGEAGVTLAGGASAGSRHRFRPVHRVLKVVGASKSAQRARLARYLAPQPAFAGCRRATMQRVAEWGELVAVEPGVALVREDHGDFWFFVVLEGHVRLSRGGADIAVLGPGTHFGQHAIVGLRPQPATATTVDPCQVYILGPRYLVSVLEASKPFRRALFPDVDPDAYRAFSRRMHAEGRVEWHRLTPPLPARSVSDLGGVVVHRPAPAPASPTASWRTSVPGGAFGRRVDVPAVAAPVVVPRWLRMTVALVTALVLAVTALWYHPPRAVVTAGRPIDVMGDIRVNGAPPGHPAGRGRYLLLWVRTARPNLLGYLADTAKGDTTYAVTGHATRTVQRAAERDGRKAYLDSQRAAIAAAAAAAGVDLSHVSVTIRDRGFVGPSAGLVYALALTDLLRGTDTTGGRIVGATGALDADGQVGPVGWVPIKAHGASHAGATVLLVPVEDESLAYGAAPVVIGVASLRQAEDALQRSKR